MKATRLYRSAAAAALAALVLTACSSTNDDAPAEGETTTVTVEDNFGEQTVTVPTRSVVATDNTTFQTLDEWGVPLKAGAVALMPDTISYKQDSNIVDLGTHREPNLEAIVGADPDLIINGNRFAQFREDFGKLAPNATIVDVTPRKDQPLDSELKRGTTVLGEVFAKQSEAQQLNDEFDKSIARVKAAYGTDTSVMGVIVSGGKIGYVAPHDGRTIGPMFDIFGFEPALEVPQGSTGEKGDDISVEAIAQSNPGLIIVMDRDAATTEAKKEGFTPAAKVIEGSVALQNVDAVKSGNVIYMPADTYTNESIQTYTAFFNSLAELLEKKNTSNS